LVGSLLDGEVEISTLDDFPKVARYHEFKEVKGEGGRAVRVIDQGFFHAVTRDPFGITRNFLAIAPDRDNLQGIQGRRKAWTRTF
jgi:hypothetical protein